MDVARQLLACQGRLGAGRATVQQPGAEPFRRLAADSTMFDCSAAREMLRASTALRNSARDVRSGRSGVPRGLGTRGREGGPGAIDFARSSCISSAAAAVALLAGPSGGFSGVAICCVMIFAPARW